MVAADLGEVPGGLGAPLFLDQTEAWRAEKTFFRDHPPPPPLSQGLDDRAPLSEGLDPPLYWAFQLNRCLSQAA